MDLEIRPAGDDDIEPIVALCQRALKWRDGEPNEALFRWKHLDNPFGRSHLWVACDQRRIVGVRPMMRWRFCGPGATKIDAVRAVDTATDPEYQGRGIFSRLTRIAIDELTAQGVGFVFNTPNEQSRPGYLKLGWSEAGRVRIVVRPTRLYRAWRLAGARVPAAKWSERLEIGDPIERAVTAGSAYGAASARLRTDVSDAYLAWRYGLSELCYRSLGDSTAQAILRVRRRGSATEGALVDVFGSAPGRAVAQARKLVPADYLIATEGTPGTARFAPLPRLGPRLVVRPLAGAGPELGDFDLRLGDIELF